MLNSVILIGRLVRDPDMRYTATGKGVCGFTLAVDRPFTNQDGEREADFLDVVTWGKLAETCANHLSKGRLVAVSGRIQTRTWTAKDGGKRKAVEVVAENVRFLDRRREDSGGADEADMPEGAGADDIPF